MPRLNADTTWPPAVGESFPITNPKMPMGSGLRIGDATRVGKDQVMIIWNSKWHDDVPMNRINREIINGQLYYHLMDQPPPEEPKMSDVAYYERINIKAVNLSLGDYLIMGREVFFIDNIERTQGKITVSWGGRSVHFANVDSCLIFRPIPMETVHPNPSKGQQRDEFILKFQRADTNYARGALLWDTFHRD